MVHWKIQTSKSTLVFSLFILLIISFWGQPSKAEPGIVCKNYTECKNLFENTAKHFIGSHYSYGNKNQHGFDCSGLVLTMIGTVTHKNSLPRSSQDMYRALDQSVSLGQAKTGDLLFFNTGNGISHVGLYWGKDAKGNHIMFHSSSSKGVEMRTLNTDKYWMARLVGVKRFLPMTQALSGENAQEKEVPKKEFIQANKGSSKKTKTSMSKEASGKKKPQVAQNTKQDELNDYADYYYEQVSYEDDMYQTSYADESYPSNQKTYYQPEGYYYEDEYELSYR
jgi:hypothetical protein